MNHFLLRSNTLFSIISHNLQNPPKKSLGFRKHFVQPTIQVQRDDSGLRDAIIAHSRVPILALEQCFFE